jgi:Ser/Thr protein kinase RdoA (MazF antagonist)
MKLFLKEKPKYITYNHFILHLRLHEYVKRRQGPIASILRATNGQLWFRLDGRIFELQEWVEGKSPIPPSLSDSSKIGGLLGHFQNSVKEFKSERHSNWRFPTNRSLICPERWFEIANYTKFLNNALSKSENQDAGLTEGIQRFVEEQGRSIEWTKLPRQFIYGDFDCLNCLKNSMGRMVLVDLDLVHWGYRMSDIAFAAAVICGMEYSRSSGYHIRKKWQSDMERRLLSGYEEHVPMSNYEKQCLGKLFALNLVRAFVSCLDLDCVDPKIPSDFLEQIYALHETLTYFG